MKVSNLNQLVEEISNNSLFQRLKSVVENSEGWHDQEDVFSHSLKTAKTAQEQRKGMFIVNEEAKNLFSKFMEEKVGEIGRKDIVVLVGLLHDCGKILSYKESGEIHTLITNKPKAKDQTMCPGHEYYGGVLVVREILKTISLSSKVKNYIANLVRLHDTFNSVSYFTQKSAWSIEEIVTDVKSRAEGYYIEAMFNSYSDCYTAKAFLPAKKAIEKVFNSPLLYKKRTYFIP